MYRIPELIWSASNPSRRRFVTGAAAGAALLGVGFRPGRGNAQTVSAGPGELSGDRFELAIGYQPVNFTGAPRTATTVQGSLPAPVLRWREGDRVRLRVRNNLAEDSSIHWHGIILPTEMDGVPGMSFAGIRPGEYYDYEFDVRQSGTYWYHSHSAFQEQTGLYGAIVIEPRDPDPVAADRDYVVMLSDWSDDSPHDIYSTLKKISHYYNFNERTAGDLLSDIRNKGVLQTFRERMMWNEMRMSESDLADVTGYTYTYLMNGVTPDSGWTGLFRRGEKVRLRIINASAMTIFDVRIPGLKMTVVAADGQNVEPVSVDEFRIGVAETYDVVVEPDGDSAYTLFAQSIDRTGYARGTLTSDPALQAAIPAMDPVPVLGHYDMGMAMDDEHAGHDMASVDAGALASESVDHAAMGHAMPVPAPASAVDHSMHAMESAPPAMPAMDHSMHDMAAMSGMQEGAELSAASGLGRAGMGSNATLQHARTEYGPQVDMRTAVLRSGLNDPGIGLREHADRFGRRVLTYADLRNLGPTLDRREPGRELQLHLTGNMHRYMWSVDGVSFADAPPIDLRYGERLRITLVNDTMMTHPIHLHGMWSELETGDPDHIPRKHTVLVQPGSSISYLVTADAYGRWAYHCHLLYHMPGMMREVRVA